jgi:hemerythrin
MIAGWKAVPVLGHAEIDAQHHDLFRRAAELLEAMAAGDRPETALRFDVLETCLGEHFAAEELLMVETQFPGTAVHRAAHQRFVRDLRSLRKLHDASGGSEAVTVKARSRLIEWLNNHVRSTGQQLGRHLLGRTAVAAAGVSAP